MLSAASPAAMNGCFFLLLVSRILIVQTSRYSTLTNSLPLLVLRGPGSLPQLYYPPPPKPTPWGWLTWTVIRKRVLNSANPSVSFFSFNLILSPPSKPSTLYYPKPNIPKTYQNGGHQGSVSVPCVSSLSVSSSLWRHLWPCRHSAVAPHWCWVAGSGMSISPRAPRSMIFDKKELGPAWPFQAFYVGFFEEFMSVYVELDADCRARLAAITGGLAHSQPSGG